MALITCKDVAFGYETGVVVSEVSFEVNSGEYFSIVGENGSGKSTLIKGILGLKKPLRGSIVMGEGLRAKDIGYLPQQNTARRYFPASVYEIVISGCLNNRGIIPFYGKAEKNRALEALQTLGIESMKKRCFSELSGGQQQRVLLARAMCATNKILLLDEPVTGLDPVITNEFYDAIKMLNSDYGITVIMISHDIQAAVKDSTNILHLRKTPLFLGTTKDYRESDIGKAYLDANTHVLGRVY